MWTADPAIGGNTVSHTRINVVAAVILLQPVHIVVIGTTSGISQLEMIETVSLAWRVQMQFADHLGLVTSSRQFTCQAVWWIPLRAFESDTTVGCRRGTSHQTAPCWNTTRTFGIPATEMRTRATNPIQIWGLQAVGTVGI